MNPDAKLTTYNGETVIQSGNQYTNPAYASSDLLKAANYTPPTTLSSTNLTPSTSLTIPPIVPATAAAGLQGTIESQSQNFAKSLVDQNAIDTAKANNTDYTKQIDDIFGQLAGKGAAIEAAYQAAGVDTAQKALTDVNNQILNEENSLNHQKDAIYNTPGITREQADQQFSEVQRRSLSKRADLSVVQYAAQNRFGDAKSIADRKVEMQFEPLTQKLDALKFFYNENKDTLTKAEDKQFQAQISERSRLLDEQKTAAKTLQNTKLEAIKAAQESGAPTSILSAIQAATTPEAAQAAGGRYIGALDRQYKQAQIDLLNASARAKVATTGVANGGVSQALQDAINNGTIDPNRINSRTLSIYNALAQAGTDAVGSHAGAAGETKAITDLSTYKSTATRTLGVLESNLPLVENLADKVNQTGVPGLDTYIAGIKSYTGNNPDVIKYVNSLKTLRAEYAQMLAKGSVATEGDKHDAEIAIPAGLSSDGYRALGEQLKLEATNILKASDDAIQAAKSKSASNKGASSGSGSIVIAPDGTQVIITD